jgi:polar amino acid transport system permease protein
VVGLAVAILRVAPIRPLRLAMIGYVQLFQGTPLLLQLFVVFFGADLLGFEVDAWSAAALGLTLYTSAFLGEIWRGSIEAVPAAQWEAARGLALRYGQALRLVILPQAVRIALPPTTGFLVQVVKSTSLASVIGFVELTRTGQLISKATYRPLLVSGVVGGIYFVLCWPLSLVEDRASVVV